MVDVGAPSDGIGGISKQSLLIGALVIGGGIGLVVFLSRKASAPSANAENKAQVDVPVNNMAYQNLAEQLLGFRGDVSVANANLAQGEQDILSQLGAESASRIRASNLLQASVWQTFVRASDPTASWDYLMNQNPYLPQDPSHPYTLTDNSGGDGASTSPANPASVGAGGATPHDAILAAFGANDDDADYYLARMSAGPVRQLTTRSY